MVDRLGIRWWIKINDSTLDLVKFWNPCGLGCLKTQKHLMESCGTIYIVERYLDREWRGCRYAEVVGFKVYKSTVFRFGPDRKVGLGKPGTWLKSSFLSIENRAYVAISWTPKTRVGPHGSCRIDGKNREVQPLSNFFF